MCLPKSICADSRRGNQFYIRDGMYHICNDKSFVFPAARRNSYRASDARNDSALYRADHEARASGPGQTEARLKHQQEKKMSDSQAVIYAQEGGVVILTLNEPKTRNAISPAIVEALTAACDRVNNDMSVSCVVITGAGKSFSSGGNVKDMRDRVGLFGNGPAEIRRGY